jgi:hypothetical protein
VKAEDFNIETQKIVDAGGTLDTTKGPTDPLETAIQFRDSLPTGSKERAQADARIAKMITSKTTAFDFDPGTGAFSFREGVDVGGDSDALTKATRNKIQADLLDTTNAISRLREVEQAAFETLPTGELRPREELLTLPGKLGQAVTSLKEFVGVKLNPEEKQSLTEFSNLKRSTIANVNRTLNELSGAAVSPQEAIRLRNQLPDAGDGIFDGDGPTPFFTKLNESLRSLKLSKARLNYIQKNGFEVKRDKKGNATNFLDADGSSITLDGMDEIMDARGQAIFDQLTGGGVPEAQAEQQAIQQIKIEFGL